MSGLLKDKNMEVFVEELASINTKQQSEQIVDFYATTRNHFQPIQNSDFSEYIENHKTADLSNILVSQTKIQYVIRKMNKKSSCIPGDLPIKLISEFSEELSSPLSNVINSMFETGIYPHLWKTEVLTPAPKVFPTLTVKQLRPILGLLNFAKITDRIVAEYMTEDMSESRDRCQYGNEKLLSINHYLIKMLNKILTSVDSNSTSEKFAVMLTMCDWYRPLNANHTKLVYNPL